MCCCERALQREQKGGRQILLRAIDDDRQKRQRLLREHLLSKILRELRPLRAQGGKQRRERLLVALCEQREQNEHGMRFSFAIRTDEQMGALRGMRCRREHELLDDAQRRLRRHEIAHLVRACEVIREIHRALEAAARHDHLFSVHPSPTSPS